MPRTILAILIVISALCCPSVSASAQETEVPYWASIKADVVYMRVGPSESYPIEWVYRRVGLPVKVVRLNQGWRLVQDPDGAQGWVFNGLLTRTRHAIVTGEEPADMRELPDEASALRWKVEPGVVGQLGDCSENWCEFDVEGRAGWIAQERLWGAGAP